MPTFTNRDPRKLSYMIIFEVALVLLMAIGLIACGVLLPLWELLESRESREPSQ